MKRALLVMLLMCLMVAVCAGVLSSASGASDDPSVAYVKQTVKYEDSSINLWFEHSFKKVMTSDVTPSGMDTYSVYMAKNEIENAQFVLCSDTLKSGLKATVTDFKDADKNTISAELYYQMYVTLTDLDTTSPLGSSSSNTFIREGEQPDPVLPYNSIESFQLNPGKSQAFYIRLKTTEATKSGWYSAQLNINNESGQLIKTATVYAYVWDFAIPEKTALQTAFYLKNDLRVDYETAYRYFLENRMNAMDIPLKEDIENYDIKKEYLTDDRVQAIRISQYGSGAAKIPSYMDGPWQYKEYKGIYDNLSNSEAWTDIKDKFYFYTTDEPMSKEQQDAIGSGGSTIDDVKARSDLLANYWPNANTVVPFHENHPYPYNTYPLPMSQMDKSLIRDATQEMLNTGCVTTWCPHFYSFTPSYEINADTNSKIRNINGTISGSILKSESYFNWNSLYGELRDRIISHNKVENAKGGHYKLWTYSSGWNSGYSYCNHLIENTGLQTKMLFWQLYQNDITGYLYYGTNNWNEYDKYNNYYVDRTFTGARTNSSWKVNKNIYPNGKAIYGNGVLFYDKSMGKIDTQAYIGSIRIEMIRDGIEEYQMLTMLEEYKGNGAAHAIVDSVSKNVVNYLSMPDFSTSSWSSDMDEYDIMAAKRKELGNAVEAAAIATTTCEQHVYDEGVVIKPAGCLTLGTMEYTCTKCGQKNTEDIPALHTEGSCFDKTIVTPAKCTTEDYGKGKVKYTCRICNYSKVETVPANHTNPAMFTYQKKSDGYHYVICNVCKKQFNSVPHRFFSEYTNSCTKAGYRYDVCADCGFRLQKEEVAVRDHYHVKTHIDATCTIAGEDRDECKICDYRIVTPIAALGHDYVDGFCTRCREPDPNPPGYARGDINNDANVDNLDLYLMKVFLNNVATPTELERKAADTDFDGIITLVDLYLMKVRILFQNWDSVIN